MTIYRAALHQRGKDKLIFEHWIDDIDADGPDEALARALAEFTTSDIEEMDLDTEYCVSVADEDGDGSETPWTAVRDDPRRAYRVVEHMLDGRNSILRSTEWDGTVHSLEEAVARLDRGVAEGAYRDGGWPSIVLRMRLQLFNADGDERGEIVLDRTQPDAAQ